MYVVFDGVSHIDTNLHTTVQAVSDASNKLKWAIGLQSNLDQLPGPQILYVIIYVWYISKDKCRICLKLVQPGATSTRSRSGKTMMRRSPSARQDYDDDDDDDDDSDEEEED